jgi:hypothetical protein
MFDPLKREDFDETISSQPPKRADLKMFLNALLDSHGKDVIDKKEHWRYKLAVDIIRAGSEYFVQKKGYDKETHQVMIKQVIDIFGSRYDEQM